MNYQSAMKRNDWQKRNGRVKTARLGSWLESAREQLLKVPQELSSSLRAIVSSVLNKPSHFSTAHPEYELTEKEEAELNDGFERLVMGEPLPYITGKQEFFKMEFLVNPSVLIPRPETEILVSEALEWMDSRGGVIKALDIGTGSGCIAVSIAKHLPDVFILGTDISFNALITAQKNSTRFGLEDQIAFIQAHLLDGIYGQFDCIFTNLPYIPTDRYRGLQVSRHEPKSALDGGNDGLIYINILLLQATTRIKHNGLILLEIDSDQRSEVERTSAQLFPDASVKIINDLAGKSRIVRIQL